MRRRHLLSALAAPPLAARADTVDRTLETSDGVRLHYTDQGRAGGLPLLFVPGWTMPAWIFRPQIEAFSRGFRTLGFDPRGQGFSDVPATGYDAARRGRDIAELIARIGAPPVIVAWSLGVLDTLAMIADEGDARVAALVLVDNSIGEEPAPVPRAHPKRGPTGPHEASMRSFVASMFRTQQAPAYLDALTAATLRTPAYAAARLLNYERPRTYWRDAVYSVRKPILYVVRPGWLAEQGRNLVARDPAAELVVMEDAGHALFVDQPNRFDRALYDFLVRRVVRA